MLGLLPTHSFLSIKIKTTKSLTLSRGAESNRVQVQRDEARCPYRFTFSRLVVRDLGVKFLPGAHLSHPLWHRGPRWRCARARKKRGGGVERETRGVWKFTRVQKEIDLKEMGLRTCLPGSSFGFASRGIVNKFFSPIHGFDTKEPLGLKPKQNRCEGHRGGGLPHLT